MLVLSRKSSESIRIGQDIEVKVVSVRGNRVQLAVSAPREVPVHRSELVQSLDKPEGIGFPSSGTNTPACTGS